MLARDQHRLCLVALPPGAVKPARTLALLRRPLVVRPPSWPFFSASLLCQACACQSSYHSFYRNHTPSFVVLAAMNPTCKQQCSLSCSEPPCLLSSSAHGPLSSHTATGCGFDFTEWQHCNPSLVLLFWREAVAGELSCDGSTGNAEYRGCGDAVSRLAVHYAA